MQNHLEDLRRKVEKTLFKALECITARYQNAPSPPAQSVKTKGEDGLFSEMVCEMLSLIPDSVQKAMLEIEIQQKKQLKYSSSAPNPQNYFPMPQFRGLPNIHTTRNCKFKCDDSVQPYQASPSTHGHWHPSCFNCFKEITRDININVTFVLGTLLIL